MTKITDIRLGVLQVFLFFGLMIAGLFAYSQEADSSTDSLFIARLTQNNLELYTQIDSLNQLIKVCDYRNVKNSIEIDSIRRQLMIIQAKLITTEKYADSNYLQHIQLAQKLIQMKEEILLLNRKLMEQLELIREKDFQLSECQIILRDVQSDASLHQAKLEGKIDVNNSIVEAKVREIAYLKQAIIEKDKINSEKSNEMSSYYYEKRVSLQLVDSLARVLNAKELELVKVNERLKIIEGQYNELLALKTAAQDKKKKFRFVQGVALKAFRTPDYQLAPQSSATTTTNVIANKNSGKIEFDFITGVSLTLFDLSKSEGKYSYDAGMYVGFGGTNLFKNFYVAPSFKAFDYFHFMLGVNIAEYQQLKTGFKEGDALLPGMSIPTVKEWKVNAFFGMTIDIELLANMTKKI